MSQPSALPILNPTIAPGASLVQVIENDPAFLAAREKVDAELRQIRQEQKKNDANYQRAMLACATALTNSSSFAPSAIDLHVKRNFCRELDHHFDITLKVPLNNTHDARFVVELGASLYEGEVSFSNVRLSYYDPTIDAEQDSDEEDNSHSVVLTDLAALDVYRTAHELSLRFAKAVLDATANPIADPLREVILCKGLEQALNSQVYSYRTLYSREPVNAWRSQYRVISMDDLRALYDGNPGQQLSLVFVRSGSDDGRPEGFRVLMSTQHVKLELRCDEKGRRIADCRVTGFDSGLANKLDHLNAAFTEGRTPGTELTNYFSFALLVSDTVEHSVFPRNTIVINTPKPT